MTKVAYCNVGGDKNGVGGCGCKIQIKCGMGGLKQHIVHRHYNTYVATRDSHFSFVTTPNKRPFNQYDWWSYLLLNCNSKAKTLSHRE